MTHLRLACILALALLGAAIAPASAGAAEPALKVGISTPDFVAPGKSFLLVLSVQRLGEAPLSGNISVNYTFPAGVAPVEPGKVSGQGIAPPTCLTAGQMVECETDVSAVQRGSEFVFESFPTVDSGAEGVLSGEVEVSGAGSGEAIVKQFALDTGPVDPFSVRRFDVALDDGLTFPSNQAGSGSTEMLTRIGLTSEARVNQNFPNPNFLVTAPSESFRTVVTHLPAGFVGYPNATPKLCTSAQLTSRLPNVTVPQCPLESQVGLVQLYQGEILPLYNVVPPAGSAAELGFQAYGVVITLDARVRPSDNGIDLVATKSQNTVPIPSLEVAVWGIPGDPAHNFLRGGACLHGGLGYLEGDCSIDVPQRPFLRNPTSCTGSPLTWGIEVDTYQHPGTFVGRENTTPAIEGCGALPFDPRLSATPTERGAGAPSGLDVELSIPQENGTHNLSQADLRKATVALPQGVAINPPSAEGLASCSDAQLRLGLEGPSQCPEASKLGTVEVTTPLLDQPLGGSVFLRSQASDDPASGDMYRLAIELRSDRYGVAIKLPGSLVVTDSGQLIATFDDQPQLPFEEFQLHFKTGPRAPLSTPSTCGTYNTHAELTSWSGKVVQIDSPFVVDQNCEAAKFAPGFQAGVQNNTAGEFSPFNLRVTRGDGQPNVSRIDTTLPAGELAKLAGVGICPDAAAATGECPASIQVGTTTVGAGNGPSPLYLPQPGRAPTAVYLAGPYKGAPYSLLVKVPAQAGPFDLGTVAVRSALHVDPATTRVSVTSDPLPQIIAGVPVAYRDVRVTADRPGFTLNPTNCEPMAVTGSIAATTGEAAGVSDRFQVGDCAALGFKPRLSLSLKGKTRRGGNPALTAVLKMPKIGTGANVGRASVSLPGTEFIAQDHLDNVCTRVQYAAGAGGGAGCPKGSVYGRARAFSPLLDKPLEGPVYLRSNGGERELPDLVASLGGQIHVDLVGYVDSNKRTGGLRTTFAKVPDAPVTKFVLKMGAGEKSLLENSTNICRGRHRAIAQFDGQNGKARDLRPLVRAKCGKARTR